MKKSDAPVPRPEWHSRPALVFTLLIAATALAWANSWSAPFVFDDIPSIVENRGIRELAPLSWLNPPHTAGETVSGRPLLNFTFALNHAVSGPDVWSYHVLNGLIHAFAALALWAVLRRLPPVTSGVALATALLWTLHPLQTAAVTYVVQRAESLAALFTLLTVYGFLRSVRGDARAKRWQVAAAIACLAGIATKETAAAAPLLVLLLDRTFFAGSFREAWRLRARFYASLAASWLVLAVLVWANRGRGGSVGSGAGVDAVTYGLTQTWAVVHYLRLALWPVGQAFDYGMFTIADAATLATTSAMVLTLLAVSAWGFARRSAAGVAGLGFFLLLAPTSSVIPIATQTVAEHRMYLALAAPLLLLSAGVARVLAGWRVPAGVAAAGTAALATVLGLATHARNETYRTARSLWSDTTAVCPTNPRAHYNLGLALLADGARPAADKEFLAAVALQPAHAYAQFQLGLMAMSTGALADAQTRFAAAVAADPSYVDARVNLAQVLERQGRVEDAVAQLRAALALQPANDIRVSLAGLLIQLGRAAEAAPLIEQALAEPPDLPETHFYYARLRERSGDAATAERELRVALRTRPAYAAASVALGNLIARQGRFAEAVDAFRAALAAEPGHYQVRNNLANCYLALRRFPQAIAEYELILKSRPNDAAVRANLGIARSMLASP